MVFFGLPKREDEEEPNSTAGVIEHLRDHTYLPSAMEAARASREARGFPEPDPMKGYREARRRRQKAARRQRRKHR